MYTLASRSPAAVSGTPRKSLLGGSPGRRREAGWSGWSGGRRPRDSSVYTPDTSGVVELGTCEVDGSPQDTSTTGCGKMAIAAVQWRGGGAGQLRGWKGADRAKTQEQRPVRMEDRQWHANAGH